MTSLAEKLETERLVLRVWQVDDAPAALDIYGHGLVARWLSPEMGSIPDLAAMRALLRQWISQHTRLSPPAGRWVMERRLDRRVIGGVALLPLPPGNDDLEISWQLHPDCWADDYASEAMHALASWAFAQHIDEIFAVVRPGNTHAATTVRRNGMQWVGETDKYFGLSLDVFRLRAADLNRMAPESHLRPGLAAD